MSVLLTIDVAHPPRNAGRVESELLEAWSRVRNSGTLRLLKIIHGHGSSGRGGSTKVVVRNWTFRNRGRFKAVIEGELYSRFDVNVQEMRLELGLFDDSDIENGNPGITLIWVK